MTSEIEHLKTNDILRRRKLRLQQVREQSKSIAKRVRQRTSAEKLRQICKETTEKEQDCMKVRDQFVKELKEYYLQSVTSIGEGHKEASVAKEQGSNPIEDLSRSRGRAAVAEVRKKKQEKLNNQKKVLDRKLLAREVANEISREKHVSLGSKLSSKLSTVKTSSDTNTLPTHNDGCKPSKDNNDNEIDLVNPSAIENCDMATQWEAEETLQEWNPTVPSLPLPVDEEPKDTDRQLCKSKRNNLFSLSDDMPNSLRGGLINTSSTYEKVRPSLTLVTEYLQARAMRLREPEPSISSKKQVENLDDVKQTIIRTRSTRNEGVCVLDNQIMHVPSWHPEVICPYCNQQPDLQMNKCSYNCSDFIRNHEHNAAKFRSNKSIRDMFPDKQTKAFEQSVSKKPSVTMYNHSTRDTQDVPFADTGCVMRDQHIDEDAFSQAIRHNSSEPAPSHTDNNIQRMRSKVAITKVNVEKEYKDTMQFLNTVHKNKAGKPIIKNVYKDDKQQQEARINHQRKLDHEYKKNVKEHKRHTCRKSNHNKSKSLTQKELENEFENDFEYSWMPVPESDDNLAIHTIPTTLKEPKSGNSVKFNKVDGYHEYRSRHKHTPPTKDSGQSRSNRKVVEAVFVEDIEESSVANETDTGSPENTTPEPVSKVTIDSKYVNTSDAERIIIYKIIESKKTKKDKKSNASEETKTQNTSVANETDHTVPNKNKTQVQKCDASNNVSLQQLEEGIYKSVADKGVSYNMLNYYRVDTETWRSHGPLPWWTNVSMMSMHPEPQAGDVATVKQADQDKSKNAPLQWEIGDQPIQKQKPTELCNCGPLSSCTSASSFKSANKVNQVENNGGYIKLGDDDGQEAGKFYIGASGILRDDAYEVVFHVRKKDAIKTDMENKQEKPVEPKSTEFSQDIKKPPLSTENTTNVPTTQIHPTIETLETNEYLTTVDSNPQRDLIKDGSSQHTLTAGPKKGISKSVQVEPCVKPILDTVKSTFTQTSFSSPTDRQVFIQMSSSASTSYMSPPEQILPNFVKNRHGKTEYCVRHHNCRCRNCALKRPGISPIMNSNEFTRKLLTPPNTVRSNFNTRDYTEPEHGRKKKKHRCRKATSQKDTKTKKSVDSSHSLPSNQEVWDNLILRFTSETSSSQARNTAKHTKSKPNLNPLIKTYIDHLLSLNSESLKAIEVVNLQCSSVSTPGSSIIEVPHNISSKNSKDNAEKKISLEQIKKFIEKQLVEKLQKIQNIPTNEGRSKSRIEPLVTKTNNLKVPKKKPVHKVKSLNISKSISKSANNTSLSKKNSFKSCSKPTNISTTKSPTLCTDVKRSQCSEKPVLCKNKKETLNSKSLNRSKSSSLALPISSVETMVSGIPMRSEVAITPIDKAPKKSQTQIPVNSFTQTNQAAENELNFIKIAESKLQNMEKIADLTEKCTTRLSNLAKVLEEVRKNKCAPYPHGSSNDDISNSDKIIDKTSLIHEKIHDEGTQCASLPKYERNCLLENAKEEMRDNSEHNSHFTTSFKTPWNHLGKTVSNTESLREAAIDHGNNVKTRTKPPPALSNYGKYYVTPHELSTVVEVESPMSLITNTNQTPRTSTEEIGKKDNNTYEISDQNGQKVECINPDLIQKNKIKTNIENEDSKPSMLDLNQFNKIMLQPFLSIHEYAKDVNIVSIDEASNVEDLTIQKEGSVIVAADDVSSLHSDGSLPDVVSELLKRKLIAEPFKFDSGSNGNSTTVSTDSTLSILKIKKSDIDKRKSNFSTHNKENVAESSDSISISSNPDLENAFKKLGMGWASSTLKKTKERLALSSSSNTSSSSLSQFKMKSFNQDIPALVTDSISSVTNVSRKKLDKSKHAEQQTVISNSMTVKEFLTTELAKKITFTKKPERARQQEDFVSLYETKIPEELKNDSHARDRSVDHSQNGNRARTSTPVQIYKSMTYHSSSTSNTSNGLFSNADDLSSVKGSNSIRNHSTSDKDDLTIPNYSLKMRKSPDDSKSE